MSEWQQIETAPKDGTKVDLLFPYPRGRTIDCYWENASPFGGQWIWRVPTWNDKSPGGLLPENVWHTGSYPNMMPTHWMPPPLPPQVNDKVER